MKLFNVNDPLTRLAATIMAEDIDTLEVEYKNGWDINVPFDITEGVNELPITLVLSENKANVLKWLVAKKVDLNNAESPAILTACANADLHTIQFLIDHGADVNAKHRIGKTAIADALYNKNYAAIPLLLNNGYDLQNDGSSLRQAVSNQQIEAVQLFLDRGIDVNFCTPNMVYPYNSTPVHTAVVNDDLEMVKLLVRHGADVTIKDDYGERPFNVAIRNKNEEMARFIQSLEPAEWHDEAKRLDYLKTYKLPKALVTILTSKNRKMVFDEGSEIAYIIFNDIINVKEVQWNSHTFLDLLSEVSDYEEEGFLVWYPKKECFAFADYEHNTFKELGSAEAFFENPSKHLDMIFE